eukprot:gene15956-17561_t
METQEWQHAREWLRATKAVPPGSKIHQNGDLFDFAQSLRDGVILVEVANTLKPGAIKDFTRATHMSTFFCVKNIRSFLKACETIFHIPQKDLFSANDLYDVSDFEKVIHVLSLLSKTKWALDIGLPPFPPKGQPVRNERRIDEQEEIYSRLEDAVVKGGFSNYDEDTESIYDPVTIAESEKIYEDIVKCVKAGEALYAKEIPHDKRSHVINEILQTEENYVNALTVMIEHFVRPLKTSLKVHEREVIFLNTEKLRDIHQGFFMDLRSTQGVNLQSFFDYSEKFLEYAQYCSRMQEAQELVSQLCKDTKFNQLVEECKRKSGRKFPLHEQLIVPFQRILKYPLLLRELLKQTPVGHPEREMTEKAFELMEDIARYINTYKKDDEMKKAIAKIEASVKMDHVHNDSMANYGRFVNDGEVQVKLANDEKNNRYRRYAFLFDKYLLLCKQKGEFYEMKEKLDLKKFRVDEDAPSGKGKFSFAWNLHALTADDATEKNDCTMYVQSSNMKDRWVANLKMCTVKPPQRPTDQESINEQLEHFDWFVGKMNRSIASEKLQRQPDGTYLVRESDHEKNSFVLSVIYKDDVKHIKIIWGGLYYFLTDNVQFKSIPELIDYYKRNTLGINFPTLPTVLKGTLPPRDFVIVKHAYGAKNDKELSLKKNAIVTVMRRDGDWWYGELEGQLGFFPKTFVKEVANGI